MRKSSSFVACLLLAAPALAQQAPLPPYSVQLVAPAGESDHRGPNPVESVDVEIEWRHLGAEVVFEIELDGVVIGEAVAENEYIYPRYVLSDVAVGEHTVEVRPTSQVPCPPATERPAGCSRYLAFTVLDDGTVIPAPFNLRVVPLG